MVLPGIHLIGTLIHRSTCIGEEMDDKSSLVEFVVIAHVTQTPGQKVRMTVIFQCRLSANVIYRT
jgi:hypothetical protein